MVGPGAEARLSAVDTGFAGVVITLPPEWTATPTSVRPPSAGDQPETASTPTPQDCLAPEAETNPFVIGQSAGGQDLEMYRFGRGPTLRLIVAGIHGGYEWNTIELAEQLIAHLEKNPGIVPSELTLYVLPALNPDGEARAHGAEGRANDHGVDLNRNWPVNWQAELPWYGCWHLRPITAGPFPLSEPETKALADFTVEHVLDTMISYHSAALGIFPGGSPPDPASVRLAEALTSVSPYPYPPIDTGCVYTGTLADWGAARGTASVDLELSTHSATDLATNLRILDRFLTWQR